MVLAVAWSSTASAVPGPDSVAVIANQNVPESVALARAYVEARQVPENQLCLLDVEDTVDLTLEAFRTDVRDPLMDCLANAGVLTRIEAVLIVRGIPLRVTVPTPAGNRRVSLAAALGVWTSEDGNPILGAPPGNGVPYAARWRNPYRSLAFEPGWSANVDGVEWRLMLVTMLHGDSYEEARLLLDSAVDAEAMGGARGQFLFMNGADSARGVRDADYPRVIAGLEARGFTDVERVGFDANLTGRTLASFFVGTANLGDTIEGNTFLPGALVDNLTSFGAVPPNFDPDADDQQVSIARWVRRGVGGVHGTTDEPLNNCFPSRQLLLEYVDGSTLAEAFHRRMPFVYWRNLVLGDPMLAPYAIRPEVSVEGVADGDTIPEGSSITVQATDSEGIGVDSVAVYLDGVEVDRTDGDRLEVALPLADGETAELLLVAQKRDDRSDRGLHRPKGWTLLELRGGPPMVAMPDAAVDAGPDAAVDAMPMPMDAAVDATVASDDDGCSAGGKMPIEPLGAAAFIALLLRRRRKR